MKEVFLFEDRFKKIIRGILFVGLIVTVISFFHSPARFWSNLLINNFYFISLSLSGLFLLALQNVTNSSWMRTYQRIPEAMMSFIPFSLGLMLLGFLGYHTLYEWTHHEALKDPILMKKMAYLNIPFFLTRLVIYFVLWFTASHLIRKLINSWSAENVKAHTQKLSKVSAITIVVFALTFAFFSYDTLMSIEPHWFSTIYSVYTFSGLFVAGVAYITLSLIILRALGYLKDYVNENHFHDLGKWLFGMSTFWAYIWFCQYLLIWYSNIPEETVYYILRDQGNWQWLFWSNFAISFLLPFLILLKRESKRSLISLSIASVVILVGRWIDIYTLVAPKIYEHNNVLAIIGPYEIVSAVMFAALFTFVFLNYLNNKSLVIKDDPYFEEGLHLHQ